MSQDNRNSHVTAALRALADGQEISDVGSVAPSRTFLAAMVETDGRYVPESDPPKVSSPPADLSDLPSQTRPPFSSGGGHRAVPRQNSHAGILFRRTIIPLLLAMAVILVALGVFTLVKIHRSSPETVANNPFLANGSLFAAISFSLGACLILGSAFFHYEVKKHFRQNGGK